MGASSSTNWLSKTGPAADSPDHWDTSEIANANWGNPDLSASVQPSQEYPTVIPPTAFVPTTGDSYAPVKARKRLKLSSGSSTGKPIYRNQTLQLVLLVAIVAIMAMFLLT
jgi:hypothetical protein